MNRGGRRSVANQTEEEGVNEVADSQRRGCQNGNNWRLDYSEDDGGEVTVDR